MSKTFGFRFSCVAAALCILLAGCGQPAQQGPAESTHQPQGASVLSAADTCSLYAPVAADFINLYIRHLNNLEVSANAPDTYEWLKSNPLVDPIVASAYAKVDLVDGDPIIDAQEYPNSFESIGCPEAPNIVRLKGYGMDLTVDVKVAPVGGSPKVVGVGRLNMEDAASATAQAEGANASPKLTLPEDSSESALRLKAYDQARDRGENTVAGESSHFTSFDPTAKFLGKYPVYTDLDCEMTQGERSFWCAHGRMGEETDVTVSGQVTFLFNEDVYAQQGELACSEHICITSKGKLAGALQPGMWKWMQENCKFDDRNYYQCGS